MINERAAARRDRREPGPGSWGLVTMFVVTSCALAWVICLPLWMQDGLGTPGFLVIGAVTMFTPAVTALVLHGVERRRGPVVSLGLRPRPLRSVTGWTVLTVVAALAVSAAAMLLSAAVGTARLDVGALTAPDRLAAWGGVVATTAVLGLLTFGEELGWRGWLLPHLRPLGAWPALLMTGTVWGLWHAPLILLGYNYGRTDVTGLLMMVVFSVLVGIGLGWTRLHTGSIWPAVFGHAAINASAGGLALLPTAPGSAADPVTTTLLGWPGWVVMTTAIVLAVSVARAVRALGGGGPPGQRRSEAVHDWDTSRSIRS